MRLVAQNQDAWRRQTGHAVCPPSCWPPVTIHQPWALANSTIKSEFALASSTIHAHAIRKSLPALKAGVADHRNLLPLMAIDAAIDFDSGWAYSRIRLAPSRQP